MAGFFVRLRNRRALIHVLYNRKTAVFIPSRTHTMWTELATAFCLLLVIEGILPFLYPQRWRALVATLANMDDRQLRLMGLMSMLIGTVVLMLIR